MADHLDDDAPQSERLPITDDLIDDDMPCLRCGYNLRALRPDGKCPECGALVENTIEYVMQRVLCSVCFAPNHPSVALCSQCGSPLSNSAATASYWKPTAISAPRPQHVPDDQDEPDPPSIAWPVLCTVFSAACAFAISKSFMAVWSEPLGPFDTTNMLIVRRSFCGILMLVVLTILLAIIFLPARNYFRLKREYLRKHAAFMARESQRENEEGYQPQEREEQT